VLTHAYLVFFRGDCNDDTNSHWNFLPLLPKALLPQTRDEGPLRVNTSLAVSEEFWKVSRAFLICSLTALIINWGAIVPGQLSTVYSSSHRAAPLTFETDSCSSHSCENEALFQNQGTFGEIQTYTVHHFIGCEIPYRESSFGVR